MPNLRTTVNNFLVKSDILEKKIFFSKLAVNAHYLPSILALKCFLTRMAQMKSVQEFDGEFHGENFGGVGYSGNPNEFAVLDCG